LEKQPGTAAAKSVFSLSASSDPLAHPSTIISRETRNAARDNALLWRIAEDSATSLGTLSFGQAISLEQKPLPLIPPIHTN
jgi:hypothetical protein